MTPEKEPSADLNKSLGEKVHAEEVVNQFGNKDGSSHQGSGSFFEDEMNQSMTSFNSNIFDKFKGLDSIS